VVVGTASHYWNRENKSKWRGRNARKSIPKRVQESRHYWHDRFFRHMLDSCTQSHAKAILKNLQPCATTNTIQTNGKAYKNADTQSISSWVPKAVSDKVTDAPMANEQRLPTWATDATQSSGAKQECLLPIYTLLALKPWPMHLSMALRSAILQESPILNRTCICASA
jgi:hypothetical protein